MSDLIPYVLASRAITAALSDVTLTEGTANNGSSQAFIYNMEGVSAVTLVAAFTYGSGGTTASFTIDTALGSGAVWIPVARFDFTTASATKIITLSGLTPRTTALTLSAVSADAGLDGIIGDRWRCRATTTGTYAGQTLIDVRIHAR